MLGFIGAIAGLVGNLFKYLDDKENDKYVDRCAEIQRDILDEEKKGYYSDDAKIEELYKELKIMLDAAQTQLNLRIASGK